MWRQISEEEARIVTRDNKNVISLLDFLCFMFVFDATAPQWARASSFTRFLDHTRRTTVGRTPLGEWSARRRDLYLTTHNTHNRQTSMPPVGFEPTVSACERPQNHAFYCFTLDKVYINVTRNCMELCWDRTGPCTMISAKKLAGIRMTTWWLLEMPPVMTCC